MKKVLLFSLISCAVLNPVTLLAQKSTQKKGVSKTSTPEKIVLKTQADSLSYAFGISMVEGGLMPYLIQQGVLGDAPAVNADYLSRVEKEADPFKKDALMGEMLKKMDSINVKNAKNSDEFLQGFKQIMNQGKDKSAYNAGVAVGSQLFSVKDNFAKQALGDASQFNIAAFTEAFSNSLKSEKLLVDNAGKLIEGVMAKTKQEQESKQEQEMKVQYAKQIAESDKFMQDNKMKDGIVALPSGLQYKVLTKGVGEVPTANDRVVVHYKGMLLDGTVFDSSIDRGEPATFGVTQVIKGWTEALQLMPVGSKWELYIPYDLAYGARGAGDKIKPFSNLIFEVELMNIEK